MPSCVVESRGENRGLRELSVVLLFPGQGKAGFGEKICLKGCRLAHVVAMLTILAILVDEFARLFTPLTCVEARLRTLPGSLV